MKKSTKLMTLLMAMVLATGSLAACGGKDEPAATNAPEATNAEGGNSEGGTPTDVSLTVWVPQEDTQEYSGYEEGLTKHMCDEFNKAQSKWNIKADIKPMSEGDAYQNVTKDPSKAADIMLVAGDNLVQLVDKELVSPITIAEGEDVKNNNPELAVAGATFNDESLGGEYLFGVPFSPNTWFMYYDKSKYSEEEVKSLETMMAKDIKGTKYNFSMKMEDSWYSPAFFFAAGCNLFGADGMDPKSCDFNSKAGVSAAKYMMDLANNKKFFSEVAEEVGLSYLEDGSLAAWCGGTWNAGAVKKALGDNYAATVMPTVKIDGNDVSLKPYSSYKYIAVKATEDVQKAEAAQALAVWLGGEQCQTDRLAARETAPTWNSVAESDAAKNSPAVAACIAQGASGYKQPGITQMNNVWDPVKAFSTWAISKDAKEDKIQGELDKLVENILAEIKEG
ncbi:MAG: extracellular solute-binding protein [Lachnospiraceae bacterium]|nr:extracellular solute-binding protein [Lachnospiraceae bacterium]